MEAVTGNQDQVWLNCPSRRKRVVVGLAEVNGTFNLLCRDRDFVIICLAKAAKSRKLLVAGSKVGSQSSKFGLGGMTGAWCQAFF